MVMDPSVYVCMYENRSPEWHQRVFGSVIRVVDKDLDVEAKSPEVMSKNKMQWNFERELN